MPIHWSGNAIEMNALVCAIPAGDVAKIAADAFGFIDTRDNLVVEIEMLPICDTIE